MSNVIVTAISGRSFLVLPPLARTATPNTLEYQNLLQAVGVVLLIRTTAKTDTPSVVVNLYGVDPLTDSAWLIGSTAAITDVSTTVLKVHPGITAVANVAIADALPPNIRIEAVHADSDSITYSLSAHLLY